jgi:hypothetical protein
MLNLSGKRVLFFAPLFFGYEKEIANKLRALGASVDYFDERPGNGFVTKAVLRVYPPALSRTTKSYYKDILQKIKTNVYDYVLVVNQEAMKKEVLTLLRTSFKSAKFILYMWDSMKNKTSVHKIYEYFDECYTFDRFDVEKFPGIRFRPLFFLDDYKMVSTNKKEYDMSFIGTAHGDRYWILKEIQNQLAEKHLKFFTYLYLNNPILYRYNRIVNPDFRKISKIEDFSFSPLTRSEIIDILSKSKAVLDIQHYAQTGLTMRTFEVLAAGIKLITTNKDIMSYDFYNPANICFINRLNPQINPQFFETPFQPLPQNFYEKYSIEGWIKEIMVD